MDKNAIKKYAVWARRELIEKVSQKALQYGIEEGKEINPKIESINGVLLTEDEKKQRQALISKINDIGYTQVIDEVAYTWFNRFIALRFMEVNGYLPSHIRIFTDEAGNFKPQIMSEALHLELKGLNKEKVYELKNDNKDDELFKYLLITQCNDLSEILPKMFQKISDYTELLLPDYLLREGSVIERMVIQGTSDSIPEADWTDQVQIIGWAYQYYNSEPKDEVFAALRKNVKITKEKIPAATQLFTPDWIVRYMVENSLGRLWLEGHPNNSIKSELKYYIDEVEQEDDVQRQLEKIHKKYADLKPEEIRCIDPCMGSGHILCYMFDVLVKIYVDYGYSAREAVESIVEKNLWGLDIDERAAQLAYFAVMMKARQYDRRFLNKKNENGELCIPQPHVYSIEESNGITSELIHDMGIGLSQEEYGKAVKEAMRLVEEMHDAKEYGSIIHVTPCDWDLLRRFAISRGASEGQMTLDIHGEIEASDRLQNLINIAEALGQKYHAVITNPPYMSARGSMSPVLTKYLTKNYALSKNDMFTVFMEVCQNMLIKDGFYSMVNQQSWMFLAGFAKLREMLYTTVSFVNMIHIGAGAFEGIAGEVVQSVAFSVRNSYFPDYQASYLDETEGKWRECIEGIPDKPHLYNMSTKEIRDIPNGILCYHLGGAAISQYYNGKRLDSFADPRVGMATGDNDLFVRLWQEVEFNNIGLGIKDGEETLEREERWYPYNKGGECRRWYGNRTHIVDWYHNGSTITAFKQGRLMRGEIEKKNSECWNREYYFLESISWSKVSSGRFAVRYYEPGFIFDVAGCSILGLGDNLLYVMGALNSELRNAYIESLSPTLNFETGAIKAFPIIVDESRKKVVEDLVKTCIQIEKEEWDSYECSWDFSQHPLVGEYKRIDEAFNNWEKICNERIERLKRTEEKLNEIFIDIYGLQNEMAPAINTQDITLRKADLLTEIKSLISYAVGCMFGRYSLDKPGLVYAGGKWNPENYSTFIPDDDGIIPICDDEYFEDDIVGRFVRFVEVAFGKDCLEENLEFIASVIGGNGTPREIIRNYFINNFYSDHCSNYSVTGSGKRPIYWLFDSGKKNGFKCLIYMHRYKPDTIARIRTDYVHEQQARYRTAIEETANRIESASGSERVKLTNKLKTLKAQDEEIHVYEEKIHHLADQMISIDLDDGVKKNYEIFKDVLAKIK